jgi:hypothetical protein
MGHSTQTLVPGDRPQTGNWPPRAIAAPGAAAKSTWAEVPQSTRTPLAWCYTDRRSYLPGDSVALHLSSTVARLDVTVYKDGDRPRTVQVWEDLEVPFQPVGNFASAALVNVA